MHIIQPGNSGTFNRTNNVSIPLLASCVLQESGSYRKAGHIKLRTEAVGAALERPVSVNDEAAARSVSMNYNTSTPPISFKLYSVALTSALGCDDSVER